MSNPSHLAKASHLMLILLVSVILIGCANSAAPLPEDTTASNRTRNLSSADFSTADLAMGCGAIRSEFLKNKTTIDANNQVILSNRQRNQTAAYFGSMLLVPYAATESNTKEKEIITATQQRQDVLQKLAVLRNCPIN